VIMSFYFLFAVIRRIKLHILQRVNELLDYVLLCTRKDVYPSVSSLLVLYTKGRNPLGELVRN